MNVAGALWVQVVVLFALAIVTALGAAGVSVDGPPVIARRLYVAAGVCLSLAAASAIGAGWADVEWT